MIIENRGLVTDGGGPRPDSPPNEAFELHPVEPGLALKARNRRRQSTNPPPEASPGVTLGHPGQSRESSSFFMSTAGPNSGRRAADRSRMFDPPLLWVLVAFLRFGMVMSMLRTPGRCPARSCNLRIILRTAMDPPCRGARP